LIIEDYNLPKIHIENIYISAISEIKKTPNTALIELSFEEKSEKLPLKPLSNHLKNAPG
jgi:hypothetical protein